MEDSSNIRIIGIDETRPPRIRKEPYIDLYFKLSSPPVEEWCDDFNKHSKKLIPPAKIDKISGLFIEAYVRDMKHIPDYLDVMKKQVVACNEHYIENIRLRALADATDNSDLSGEGGEQGKLNTIIATLQFDE